MNNHEQLTTDWALAELNGLQMELRALNINRWLEGRNSPPLNELSDFEDTVNEQEELFAGGSLPEGLDFWSGTADVKRVAESLGRIWEGSA